MKQVNWLVQCTTLVDTDDDDEALETVRSIFERRPMPEDCGKATQTTEIVVAAGVIDENGDHMIIEINRPEAVEADRKQRKAHTN